MTYTPTESYFTIHRFTKLMVILLVCSSLFTACDNDDDDLADLDPAAIVAIDDLVIIEEDPRGKIITQELQASYNVDQVNDYLTDFNPLAPNLFPPNHGVDIYKVVYETIDHAGNSTYTSGITVIPHIDDPNTPIHLVAYQHGTVLDRENVPSRGSNEMLIGVGYASTDGVVVSITDYLGLGDGPGLHPYMHAETEATATIDMLRASRQLCEEQGTNLSEKLFLFGYSQGGHATMAAHKYIQQQYADEFTVTASAPMAGPYDMAGVQASSIVELGEYPAPYYLPYLLFSYNMVYDLYPSLAEVMTGDYYNTLAPYFDGSGAYSSGQVNAAMPSQPGLIITDELRNAFQNDPDLPFRVALQENNLHNWIPQTPVRMIHCNGDEHVYFENATVAQEIFEQNGATTTQVSNPLEGGTHETCVLFALLDGIDWLSTFY